jgi:hypothetical protein
LLLEYLGYKTMMGRRLELSMSEAISRSVELEVRSALKWILEEEIHGSKSVARLKEEVVEQEP